MLLGRAKLNAIKVLISQDLIGSYISHNKFFLENDELREYNETKEEISNP